MQKKIDRFSNIRNTLLVNLVAPVFPLNRNQPVDMISINVFFVYDTITDSSKFADDIASSRQSNFQTTTTSRHVNNNFSVYCFVNFELELGKSREFNNQGMTDQVKGALKAILFLHFTPGEGRRLCIVRKGV